MNRQEDKPGGPYSYNPDFCDPKYLSDHSRSIDFGPENDPFDPT